MIVICEEFSPAKREHIAQYIVQRDPSTAQLSYLSMRSRFNTDLSYWVTRLDETRSDKDILALFSVSSNRKAPLFVRV